MAKIWIGDFRLRTIRQVTTRVDRADSIYLFEDSAEYYWFSTIAANQFAAELTSGAAVIIMTGFNDCVNSCIWPNFDISKIAADYADTVNSLTKTYTGVKFYYCTINPVSAGYPDANYSAGIIPCTDLNKKIEQFNKIIKDKCTATVIDSYAYLTKTNFYNFDGIRYNLNTARSILAYIAANIEYTSTISFVPRLTAPIESDQSDDIEFWRGINVGGLNPFYGLSGHENYKYTGDTLPNCTAYAWGRFYEILGSKPTLSLGNAENWWAYTADGYKRGQTPALGAIVCWRKGEAGNGSDGAGHVAIVEQINADGSIVTSESGWNNAGYWWTKTRHKGEDGRWGENSDYTFQGFIYCPAVTPTASTGNLDKSTVVNTNKYLSQVEMEANAKYIWNYLGSRGWSLNAVAGMLGNMQAESSINPGRYEIGGGSGFGLVQWTPKSNLTDWTSTRGYADNDIDGQLERIIWEKDNGVQYYRDVYKYTFKEFSTSMDDPYTLACAFAFDYERSAVALWGANSKAAAALLTEAQKEANREALRKARGTAAERWYTFLAPYSTMPASEKKFIMDGFKLDVIKPTELVASVILKNCTSCSYKLYQSTDEELVNKQISVENTAVQVVSFKHSKNLKPNTSYRLELEAVSSIGGETRNASLVFTTPQEFPETVGSLELSPIDSVFPYDKFKVGIDTTSINWGYWKKNSHGYTVQLLVNGNLVSEKNKSSVNRVLDFGLKETFNYASRIGDTIQIGIRTWVKDDSGQKIYDSLAAKTSNPICLLAKPVTAYLNIN